MIVLRNKLFTEERDPSYIYIPKEVVSVGGSVAGLGLGALSGIKKYKKSLDSEYGSISKDYVSKNPGLFNKGFKNVTGKLSEGDEVSNLKKVIDNTYRKAKRKDMKNSGKLFANEALKAKNKSIIKGISNGAIVAVPIISASIVGANSLKKEKR